MNSDVFVKLIQQGNKKRVEETHKIVDLLIFQAANNARNNNQDVNFKTHIFNTCMSLKAEQYENWSEAEAIWYLEKQGFSFISHEMKQDSYSDHYLKLRFKLK